MNHFVIIFFLAVLSVSSAQETIVLQPGPDCGKDAFLHGLNSQSNTNFGDQAQFAAGSWTFQGIPGNIRAIVEFDLSTIPAGATITNATMKLTAYPLTAGFGQHSSLSGPNTSFLQRVTSSWSESTVTWNTQPSTTTLNEVAIPQSTGPTQDFVIDVTTLVQDMLNDPAHSYGFMLRLQTEEYYRRLNFCSSDVADPSKHPKLVITYIGDSVVGTPFSLGDSLSVCPGESITLNGPANALSYEWQDGSTNASFEVTAPGTYWVNAGTCSSMNHYSVEVASGNCPSPEVPAIVQPVISKPVNVFTPNIDNVNDVFVLESNGFVFTVVVCNRWGEVVFEETGTSVDWYGESNGRPCSEGVYFWKCTFKDNSTVTQGTLSLFR